MTSLVGGFWIKTVWSLNDKKGGGLVVDLNSSSS